MIYIHSYSHYYNNNQISHYILYIVQITYYKYNFYSLPIEHAPKKMRLLLSRKEKNLSHNFESANPTWVSIYIVISPCFYTVNSNFRRDSHYAIQGFCWANLFSPVWKSRNSVKSNKKSYSCKSRIPHYSPTQWSTKKPFKRAWKELVFRVDWIYHIIKSGF